MILRDETKAELASAIALWETWERLTERVDYLDSVEWSTEQERDQAYNDKTWAYDLYRVASRKYQQMLDQDRAEDTYARNIAATQQREYDEAWTALHAGHNHPDFLAELLCPASRIPTPMGA